MPEKLDVDIPQLVEYRGIRSGERGDRAPIKTLPRVRMPLKDLKTKKFGVDERVMREAARRLGVPQDKWTTEVKAVPVYLFSDKVEEIVYLERALYSARGRLCGSGVGCAQAKQTIDIGAYAKSKTIRELKEPRDAACDEKCPLWGHGDVASDCKWRAIVTVQLIDSPVFPSPTRYRTTSKYSIRAVLTSLRSISMATGGMLAGIPLWLTQGQLDVRDGKGESRRIPVMYFDFRGTLAELRDLAISELKSRESLRQAWAGKFELQTLAPIMDAEIVGDEDDDDDDDEAGDAPGKQDVNEVASKIALLYRRLGFSQGRQRLLEDKFAGDLDAVLRELEGQVPEFAPGPGEPGTVGEDDDDEDLYL